VLGADRAELRKPAPALLLEAARRVGVDPAELLMVGDSGADLVCARAAGCPAVLVAWGYGSAALPGGLEPWRVDDPADLLDALERAQTGTARQARRAPEGARGASC